MEDVNTKIHLLENELLELKVNKDFYENKITAAENINYELKIKLRELDCEIVTRQNELNKRLNGLRQTKEINSYSQYVQDITKRWIGYLDDALADSYSYLDYLVPSDEGLLQLAKQFVEVKNQILSKDLKPGWTRDSVKRYTDDLINRVSNNVQNDLRVEHEELSLLLKRIEFDTELLKYSVSEKQLEPPSFNYLPVKQIETTNLIEFDRKAKRNSLKLLSDYQKWSTKCDQVNMDFQQAGSSNGGHVNYRHHQQQYPSQTKPQSQEICPNANNNSETFGPGGNNGKIDELPSKASVHRVNIGESQERNEEPTSQPTRNHVKFEEIPRSHQYASERSCDNSFEQPELESRKRKLDINELPSSLEKVVDVHDDSSPDYVDAGSGDAKRGKFDSSMEQSFGSSYFDQEFLKYPNTQTDDHIFTFTQDQDFLDLNGTFFENTPEPAEEKSVKGAFH